jgi:hypothetical protein
MNAAGHSKSDMSQEYTLVDLSAQERAINAFQDRILIKPEASTDVPNGASNGPEWAKFMAELHPDVPEEIRNLLKGFSLNGGLEKTRTSDLFRVKEAL